MKLIKILYIISQVVLFTACYKDNNNYTLNPINEISISTTADTYTVFQLDNLSIQPDLSYSLDSTGDYSYEWKIFETTANEDYTDRIPYSEVLATSKDLNNIIYSPAGEYMLLYTIKDNNTGTQYFKELHLSVNSGFYEGLMVAYNTENRAELGFIRVDNEIGLNLMQELNGGRPNEQVVGANTMIVGSLRLLNLTTTSNHYQINADDFLVLRDKSTLFSGNMETFTDGFLGGNKISNDNAPSDIYYISGGKVYADMGIDFAGAMANIYSQAFSYANGDYDIFPFVFNAVNGTPIYFYDNLGKRLLQTTFNSRILSPVVRATTDVYDPATINKTAIAAMNGYGNTAYFVMHDDDNRYYLYTMWRNEAATANNVTEVNLAASPGFADATIFDARSDQRYIYYATGNQLYLYNIATNMASVVLSFSGNEQIADIQVYRQKLWQNSTNADFNKRIYIATNNGESGKVYQYTLQDNGSINAIPNQEVSGFGNIVDIDYRNPNE